LIDAFGSGRLDEAERLTEQVRAAAPDDPNQQMIFMLRSASIETLRGTSDLSHTVCGYEFLLAANPHAVNLRALLSSAYATLGRHDEARREFDAVAADDFAALARDINWLPTMALLADAVVHLGDGDRARLLHDRLLPHADMFVFFAVESTPGGAVAMWLADLAVLLGELERAEALLDRARAIHAALGTTLLDQFWALARVRLLLATRSGEALVAARRLLAQLRRYADEHGIGWLRERGGDLERRMATSPAAALELAARSAQRDRRRDN
jgi:tetratricopeptide (TPR) repeat protein